MVLLRTSDPPSRPLGRSGIRWLRGDQVAGTCRSRAQYLPKRASRQSILRSIGLLAQGAFSRRQPRSVFAVVNAFSGPRPFHDRWWDTRYVARLALDHTTINQPLKSLLHDFERLCEPIERENHALTKGRFRVVVRIAFGW